MNTNKLSSRMLLAALLPVTLVALTLLGVFLWARLSDVEQANSQRLRSLARQLATASEYDLFSFNLTHLQTLASRALREADVNSVVILNAQGEVLVRAGNSGYVSLPQLGLQEHSQPLVRTDTMLLVQPIVGNQLKVDDLLEGQASKTSTASPLLGHVLLESNKETLYWQRRDILLTSLGVTLVCLLFGWFLAIRLGHAVIEPMTNVSRLIERIGKGELSARGDLLPNDPLRDLLQRINQMAEGLELGRDELEQRIAEATLELRQKKEEAEAATQAKSRFLANASHDLRQPIYALSLFTASLAQLQHDAQTQQLIGRLNEAVQAMQDLLDGLLDLSLLEAGAVQVRLRPFAVTEVFDKLRGNVNLSASASGLRLKIRPSNAWLMSDSTLLQRILLNLVNNALRYTRTGGVLVACRQSRDTQSVCIQVWDTGIGIAPEHLEAIFQEFYQVGNSERGRSKGLGLGLNIVRGTAELLGYSLRVRSRVGQGTRFSLQVPLFLGNHLLMEPRSVPRPLQLNDLNDLGGLLLLVIEDDELVRNGLLASLTSWDVVVKLAANLSEALAHLEHGPLPDVILSDYRLPDQENGIQVIEQLRKVAGLPLPACLMSGDTDVLLMQAAKQAGLTLLHKPVRDAKLRSLIRRLSANRSSNSAHQRVDIDL